MYLYFLFFIFFEEFLLITWSLWDLEGGYFDFAIFLSFFSCCTYACTLEILPFFLLFPFSFLFVCS